MMESVYQLLSSIGYTHPLHPVLTHMPIGLVMACVLFSLAGHLFRKPTLAQTARHCSVLALLAAVPTILLGYADWQHFYAAAEIFEIKAKFVLAGALIVFLLLAVIFGFLGKTPSKKPLLMYLLCLIVTVGLGYFGAELVFGKREPAPAEASEISQPGSPAGPAATAASSAADVAKGAEVFKQNCAACHFSDSKDAKVGPGLKGLFAAEKLPSSGRAPSEENIRRQLEKPLDKMPPFGHLPPEQVEALVEYLKTL